MSVRKTRERPRRRTYESGEVAWRAQVNVGGQRRSLGTYGRRADAQAAIDNWYDRGSYVRPDTLGAYAATWTDRHPRSERTNKTNDHRIKRALGVWVGDRMLSDWPLNGLRRKHALELAGRLLTEQGRSTTGAANILRALSALCEDAITDEVCEINPFRGVRVRSNDPRAKKAVKRPSVYLLADLHRLAAAAGEYEAMVRVITDCGLRLGEVLGLEHRDFDGDHLHIRGNAHEGKFTEGDAPTKRHVRSVPVPPSTAELLREAIRNRRLDSPLLFPTVTGKLYRERNVYRDIWHPAQRKSRIFATPHECRHSYLSLLRAQGVDAADLAQIAGHSVQTANARYVHALNRSDAAVREAIG